MRYLLSSVMLLSLFAGACAPALAVQNDRFTGTGRIELKTSRVDLNHDLLSVFGRRKVEFGAGFNEAVSQPYIVLSSSAGDGWEFSAATRLFLLADSTRVLLDRAAYNNGAVSFYVTTYYETALFPVSRSDLATLANASAVDGRLGTYEFKLTRKQMEGLKKFLLEYDKMIAAISQD